MKNGIENPLQSIVNQQSAKISSLVMTLGETAGDLGEVSRQMITMRQQLAETIEARDAVSDCNVALEERNDTLLKQVLALQAEVEALQPLPDPEPTNSPHDTLSKG